MQNTTEQTMESLTKYVPFIDFVLKIDRLKYTKFINIKKWILLKKKNYPLTDLKKIEQSIITQYKNLLLEKKVEIPQSITNIFAPLVFNEFVNLCSDDEDEDSKQKKGNSSKNNPKAEAANKLHSNKTRKNAESLTIDIESEDDDLEIVSTDYDGKTRNRDVEEKSNVIKSKVESKQSVAKPNTSKSFAVDAVMDQAYQEILYKTDQLAAAEIKMMNLITEPNNYTYKMEKEENDSKDGEGIIYERRTTDLGLLFKRRADFGDEVVVTKLANDNELQSIINKTPLDIISIDSGSDDDGANKNETPSTSHATKSSKTAIDAKIETTSKECKNIENTDSNSNGSNNSLIKDADLLCIDSVLADAADVLDELKDTTNNTTSNSGDEAMPEVNSDKENSAKPLTENSNNTEKLQSLTEEQISKILEDISCKTDFEWDSFYEALLYVGQRNLKGDTICYTPHPTPPPITNSLRNPPIQLSHTPQPEAQFQPVSTFYYPQYSNFVPMASTTAPPSRPKLNMNDPRIKKQLQVIQSSQLFTCNFLNRDIEESIRKICHFQSQQQLHSQKQINSANPENSNIFTPIPHSSTSSTSHKSHINYGEYKRRQLQKKLELQKQEEDKLKAKAQEEMEQERAKLLLSKNNDDDIRSKLLSTLVPCKEQVKTLWNQQKNSTSNMTQKETGESSTEIMTATSGEKNHIFERNNGEENADHQDKNKTCDSKLNRVYKELNCTVKGFDHIQDYISTADSTVISDKFTTENPVTPKPIGLMRRSSIHALSAITEQLCQESSDPESNQSIAKKFATNLSENLLSDSSSQDSLCSRRKKRKTKEGSTGPKHRRKVMRIPDDTSDDETRNNSTWKIVTTKEPIIRLHRISNSFIKKHTKKLEKDTCMQTTKDQQSFRLQKTGERAKTLKEASQKMPKLKKYNNDCQMTERNTTFCVLCRSKPNDLTNHYIARHKTESYVSRLDWSEMEDLAINTPFAKLQPKSKNFRFERYEVECPFCKEKLLDQFVNLYNHYSTHTGEYAFQCSHCHMAKPYRPDIHSHILHSKTCRNSTIQIIYRYPPQSQCIYLHSCSICNFVQLNEANVLKHLREHHDQSQAVASNVEKCILAAISDGPELYETHKTPSSISPAPMPVEAATTSYQENATVTCSTATSEEIKPLATHIHFKVDDDDIPVSNEPCLEEEHLDEKYSLKNMQDQRYPITNTLPAMTVIHSTSNNDSPNTTSKATTTLKTAIAQRHLPIQIKVEPMDVEPNVALTAAPAPAPLNHKAQEQDPHISVNPTALSTYAPYEKYRSFDLNVSYLGLYKCMIDDCYYSTDCGEELVNHLNDHSTSELRPNEYLQCPYCVIEFDIHIMPIQLVEHIRAQHGQLNFQCSMCCYRSAVAFNTHIHQEVAHAGALNICKIYKCSSDVSQGNNNNGKQNLDVEKIGKSILKISCTLCNAGFYYTQLLMQHLQTLHGISDALELQIYSCIYCPFVIENKNQIRVHVATKHPGEVALCYDHNTQIYYPNEDKTNISNIVDISEQVTWIESTPTICAEEDLSPDVKPNLKELSRLNEEIVKVRLQKLTKKTGIPPDCLYRCPETVCGGFFSNFELWLRHMKVRHCSLAYKCPHCSTEIFLSLEEFALHFEQHRCHTFICFYCSTTNPTELLAKQHANDKHSDFGTMRYEKIQFNLNYTYTIVLQSYLFKEREKLIGELLLILEDRLKELKNIEVTKLKQQWPVRDNTPWMEDYLQIFSQRKVALRCLVKNCDFRAFKGEKLYQHLRTLHNISGTQFNCSKCDYRVQKCNNLDEVFQHIKLHNEYIFICTACSQITSSRSKIFCHIEKLHSARDVPVIHLFRIEHQKYIKIYIVFSDDHLSFSTIKNCFCCSERNMGGDLFTLHLKHYHKLSLKYYCEKCTNFSFTSLKEVKTHFEQCHSSKIFKIWCELAGHNDLYVTSLNDFRIHVVTPAPVAKHIKSELLDTSDNDVILLEDDDVEIINSITEEQLKPAKIPQLKCASLGKLMKPPVNTTVILPPPTATLYQSHFPPTNPCLKPFTSSSSLAPSNIVIPTPYNNYNLNAVHAYNTTSSSMNICNSLSSIASPSALTSSINTIYSNAIISSQLPNNGLIQFRSLQPQRRDQVNTQLSNNRFYRGQTGHMHQNTVYINPNRLFSIEQQNCSSTSVQNENVTNNS